MGHSTSAKILRETICLGDVCFRMIVTRFLACYFSSTISNEQTTERESTMTTENNKNLTQEMIAQCAYELFLKRNGENGSAEGDWLQAEAELSMMTTRTTTALSSKKIISTNKMPLKKLNRRELQKSQ